MQAREQEVPNNRVLWAVVIIMGVLILIGTVIVIATIANRLGGTVRRSEPAPVAGAFGRADLPIPPGCEVVETVPAGERLLLRLGTGERCRQLLVVEMATGRLLGTLNLVQSGQ
jgi:hypothetical protein